jgi:hypothetical protein
VEGHRGRDHVERRGRERQLLGVAVHETDEHALRNGRLRDADHLFGWIDSGELGRWKSLGGAAEQLARPAADVEHRAGAGTRAATCVRTKPWSGAKNSHCRMDRS